MPDGPDPLGKRALYWMPVDAEEVTEAVSDSRRHTRTSPGGGFAPRPIRRQARPAGKHALYSQATPAGEEEPATSSATASDPLPRRGVLSVACSSCGSLSRVGLIEFALLQFPFGAWVPRRTYDRWMTCPACRRRTWTSVTLSR